MKLYLVRHGQTDWNINKKIQGSCDTELNDAGIKQAEELGHKLLNEGYKFNSLYCSKQKRAVKTAKILGKIAKKDYIIADGLEEINLGDWQGLSWPEVKEKYPVQYNEWFGNRRYAVPPNGESYDDMLKRALKAINRIISKDEENVLIITHSAVIMCIQCYITNTPFSEMTKFKTKNTSIVEVDSDVLASMFHGDYSNEYTIKRTMA